MVDESISHGGALGDGGMCTACEMAVVWMKSQLKRNGTAERILSSVNEVSFEYISIFVFVE